MARKRKRAVVDVVQQQSAEEAHAHLRPREAPRRRFNGYPMAILFGLFGVASFAFGVNAVREHAPAMEIGMVSGFGLFWFALASLFVWLTRLDARDRAA